MELKIPFGAGREREADELTNILTSPCDSISIKQSIFLDRISLVYYIDKDDLSSGTLKRPPMKQTDFAKTYMFTTLIVNSVCDSNKRKLFSLFNEQSDKDTLDFLIITYETQTSQDVIEKIVGFEIAVIFLYVIAFRYLGVSLIKQIFFDKHALTWYTHIPEPEKLLCLLDAIRYAQFEEDHIREELLYFLLIDIMRNPETLKMISGSVVQSQLKDYHEEQERRNRAIEAKLKPEEE